MGELDRRRFLQAVAGVGAFGLLGASCVNPFASYSMGMSRHTLEGLWDAIVPGTFNGIVEDLGPGATDAGVQAWFESATGTLPAPLDFVTQWFLEAWAADLDWWADDFHAPLQNSSPTFGQLPLGPTLAESGRQYKIMLMQALFGGIIDLQYFGAISLAKLAFYCDFRAHTAGTAPVGGPYIGFPGAVGQGPTDHFTYNRPAGLADTRLTRTPGGLVAVP